MLAWARDRFPPADLRGLAARRPLPESSSGLVVSARGVRHLDATGKADLFRRVHGRPAVRSRCSKCWACRAW
jgi:hypothetical protein